MFKNALFLFAAVFFIGCASRVTTKTQFDSRKYPDIGYIAFKLEPPPESIVGALSGETGFYDLSIENVQTKEGYIFNLNDETPGSFSFYIGPFTVYQSYFEKNVISPLKLIPLPEGRYEIKYIYQRNRGGSRAWPTKNEHIKIQKDKMTYIGTYVIHPKYFLFFSYNLAVESADDGAERAESMSLSGQLIKSICTLRD